MTTVNEYLESLPPVDRQTLSGVRDTINKNIPKGYEEMMQGKFIAWVVPLSRLPKTYNGHALQYVALAKQKNYYTLYMLVPYGDPVERKRFEEGFKKAGKKLDMGKSCVHFKTLDDLPLDVIGDSIARVPMEAYVKRYEASRKR
jgi:hypothetical protein